MLLLYIIVITMKCRAKCLIIQMSRNLIIPDVPIEANVVDRVLPRQVSTGNSRGDLIVKGRILVVDDSGTIRMDLGYG